LSKHRKTQHAGAIKSVGANLSCVISLDSGNEIQARIPRHTARLMVRAVPGDRVVVESRKPTTYVVLGHEQAVWDRWIVSHLTRDGRSVSDWFLIGECVLFWTRHGDIGSWLTSDDGFYRAVRDYLRRISAPVYESSAEAIRSRPAVDAKTGTTPSAQ
jgi:translation initiation factor IF-1